MNASEAKELSLRNTDAQAYLEGINEAIHQKASEGEFHVNASLPKDQAILRVVTEDLEVRGYNYESSVPFNSKFVDLYISW